MLDTDTKLYSHAHLAGLKRLSARASAGPPSPASAPHRRLILSFSDLGRTIITHLKAHGVEIAPPLSEQDFQKIEATFKFSFPPDLRGILQEGVPQGADFPDWRSSPSHQLRLRVDLPILSICQAVERGNLWWKGWGARPHDPHRAAISARAALKKAPILVPLHGNCYIPSSPTRSGNPVFFIHHTDASLCASDLAEFFQQKLFLTRDQKLPLLSQLPSLAVSRSGSFPRIQKPHEDCQEQGDTSIRSSYSISNSDSWEWNSEAWSRNVDPLAGKSDGLARSSDGSSLSEQEQRVSKSSVSSVSSSVDCTSSESIDELSIQRTHPKPTPSLSSPHESIKQIRRIEFWNDFVEKARWRRTPPTQNLADPISEKEHEEDAVTSEHETEIVTNQLQKILQEVSTCLRTGGWKEDDISEIVDVPSPKCRGKFQSLDKQSVLEDLALQLDYLSASMTKAGWSVEDVAEALSLDLSLCETRQKPQPKLTPKLTERIGPLAAYVAEA